MGNPEWYRISNTGYLITPSLLVYPDRIQHNIDTMMAMAQGTPWLRPHVKTHKTAEIIKMQMAAGIQKFKCATIAEAELLALCNAPDILLAMQPVGANMDRFFTLTETYPDSEFSALVDDPGVLHAFSEMAREKKRTVSLWVDLNTGMDRTGIIPGDDAVALYLSMAENLHIEPKGLHAYDGHIRHTDSVERKKECDKAFDRVLALKQQIEAKGVAVPDIVAGGSPSFPFHSQRQGVQASPGTVLLWDAGYGGLFPEMGFLSAAVLLTRIISKPKKNILCLDLGHKSIAPEMAFPRVQFLGMEGAKQIGQSEEHLILECYHWEDYQVGDICYALPMHICPTVAKYETLQVIVNGEVTASWKVAARNQKINI